MSILHVTNIQYEFKWSSAVGNILAQHMILWISNSWPGKQNPYSCAKDATRSL